jgi:OmpA-OmpF porin, OOP family
MVKEMTMNRIGTSLMLWMLMACMVLAGCSNCPVCKLFSKPEPPPVEPMQIEEPAPPVQPEPAVVTPPPPAPVEVAPAVVAAIKDLGEKYPGLFTFDKNLGRFRFNSDITFDSGSSVVRPQAKAALTKLAEILTGDEVKDRSMLIVGFTDNDRVIKKSTIAHLKTLGKPANNQGLSEARAEAVAVALSDGGIDPGRISTKGKGSAESVADNKTSAGKAKNRRVEIYLSPMKK